MGHPPPLMGYNTNVRHKGKLYHIQTEDSGVKKPHIITHLFADGGRILATRKTEYKQHVNNPNYRELVKKMMREQHKAIFIELRDGVHDEEQASAPEPKISKKKTLTSAELERLSRAVDEQVGTGLGLFLDAPYVIDPQSAKARSDTPFGSELLSDNELEALVIRYLSSSSAEE